MTDHLDHTANKSNRFELLAIGGSAGSFPGMIEWIKHAHGPSIVLVIHRAKTYKSNLVQLLQHYTDYTVKEPANGEKFQKKHVYIAPAGYHLILDENHYWHLLDTEPLWHCKPAIDMLFASLAHNMPSQCMGVLLSGANEDGGTGLSQIKESGGFTLCVNPESADYAQMPMAAKIRNGVSLFFEIDDVPELCNQYVNP